MSTSDGFRLRRDHGFRNPPVQPPYPFPGPMGAWQHGVRPQSSSAPSSSPYKEDPQAAFNFCCAPGPWRSDKPHHRHKQHQQQPGVLVSQHSDNERGVHRSSGSFSGCVNGCVLGGAEKSGGEEGAAAAAVAVPGVAAGAGTPTPSAQAPRNVGGAMVSLREGKDGRAFSEVERDQDRSTQDTAASRTASPAAAATAGGSGTSATCAEEKGVAGELVLATMSEGDEGEEGGGDAEAESGDPDQGWTLSAEWEEYLRKSPGVARYLERVQATVSTWKDGRGGKKGSSKSNKSGGKKPASSSSGGAKPDQEATEALKGKDKPSSAPSPCLPSAKQRRGQQQQQQQQQKAASRDGKKSGKKTKRKDSAPAGSNGGGDSAPCAADAAAKQALDLELAKIEAQALLYAERQQHRRVEDAVLDAAVVSGPE